MTRAATAKPKPEKEKRRNNEKRKEKSRDAARCRRSRETEIFQDLAGLLPMRQEDVEHLDKASVMRLSIAFLRVRDMLELFPAIGELAKKDDGSGGDEDSKEALSELMIEQEQLALQALDGFLLVLSVEGDVTYVSENVGEYLGISQIDMMGQPVWDYTHQCDHEELREALNGRHHSPSELVKGVANSDCKPQETRDFFLRLKCTLTSRGRSVNIKSASYKVIHVTGHIACKEDGQRQLVAVARPLPHPSNIEVPLDASTFLSKHSLDMKFSYVDDKMFALLGYNPADLMGKPLYECHHGIDSEHLMGTFKNVISKGQSETARYRFLARTGGFAWVVTQATLIYDKQKPHSIVCVNYVISGVENKDEIYSCAQLEARQLSSAAEPEPTAEPVPAETVKNTSSVKTVLAENVNRANGESEPEVAIAVGKENPKPEPEVVKEPTVIASGVKPTKPPVSQVSRPVSVTASIFSSAVKKDTAPVAARKAQSVTAKLFVTLNSSPATTTGGGCNKPKHATEKIFAPRTEDMNKGFLMFSEEEPGLTMLKDEPDDLTHLAPTAGDACIPLEETGPFFNDVFDDFMIPESYTSLLQDELNSLDSAEQRLSISVSSVASPITLNGATISTISHHHSATSHSNSSSSCSPSSSVSPSSLSSSSIATTATGTSVASSVSNNNNNNSQSSGASSNDPFINYRDEISEISHSPHLLSPGLSKSPEGSSIPSLCSPNGSGGCPEDELAFMTLNMDDDLDLSMRAPYISMSEVDDLPLLTSDDLMWGAPASASVVEGGAIKYLIKDEFSGHQQDASPKSAAPITTTVMRADLTSNNTTTSNNHNIENNCNIGNKIIDSSLAALLCGGNVINIQTSTIQLQPANQQPQQQQQQQHCSRLIQQVAQDSIIAADVQQQLQQQQREILGDKKISVVHPMVVISPGYKHNSANNTIEAWAMGTDLLLSGQNSTTSSISTGNGSGNKLNVIASIVSSKKTSGGGSSSSTKRSLTASESGTDGTSKRVKSGSAAPATTTTTTSSPQLLQQLMAPSPVPAKAKARSKSLLDQSDRWPTGGGATKVEQVSNSVLMNLLVSGCDVSAGYTCFPRHSKAAKA